MNLIIDTYTHYLKLGEEPAIRLIRETGFDALDFSLHKMPQERTMLGGDYLEQAENTRRLLEKYGIPCLQCHAPVKFPSGSSFDMADPRFVEMVRAIEYAAIIGANRIVVHGVCPPEGQESEEAYRLNVRFYKALEPFAVKAGIRIAVENQIHSAFNSPKLFNRIMEAVESPSIIACLDIGHARASGFEPEDFIRQLRPGMVKMLHMHDNYGNGLDMHLLPYDGVIHWDATLKALADYGYDGDFMLELTPGFLSRMPVDVSAEALRIAHSVGRHMIRRFEEIKAAKDSMTRRTPHAV